MKEKIEEILGELWEGQGYPSREIREAEDLRLDLGFSSLEILELICEIEERLGITITDSEMAGVETVGDLICLTESKVCIA